MPLKRPSSSFPRSRVPLPARACALLLPALLAFAPGGARACRPDFHRHDRPVHVEGEAGAFVWLYDEWLETSIGPAEDLGGGFVRQELLNGDACYGEASTLVHDCNTGEAVVFGGEFDRMMTQTYAIETGLSALIEDQARAGQPLPIGAIREEALARGVEFVVPMRTTSTIALGGYEFELGEACEIHYPDLPGATR